MKDRGGSQALIAFIKEFTDLQERQLRAIHATMREAVDGVMQGIQEISSETTENKKKANEIITGTYTAPTYEQEQAIHDVQDEVTRVFESAHASHGGHVSTSAGSGGEEARDKLRRSAGLFSKHMEALETLDERLQGHLMTMMGQLSRDDVITQRIEHVMMALHALQASLIYVLTDFSSRSCENDVEKVVADLKNYLWRTYTTEEERRDFALAFPQDVPVRRAG